ncbi:MAG TPA: GntR family transcriptional regulator [Candidatus Merdisoma faecalis]|uniref:GntR family transcriptional regulator n=1 Tax=Lachnoclostridium sp. An138 TaxID=1965560 RepID=UPI000B38EDD6|nr:GntR family transcriptional regulator [Lachnoclostridium sp. An138]OUQ20883.1 GntR family transcriptional regulator [Lachnoclostridium sp. An138]HIR97287.1 GntR family transcriptional regulator [Candidatus Merdisoma faecalis]
MAWILDDTRPIYLQIEDLIKTNIIAGVYQPGQKLPSVRDLAAEASVNPNTMQKALTELERSGLVYTQRTSGRFITEDISKMTELKEQLAREQIQLFLKNMEQLGLSRDDIRRLLEKEWREEES